MRVNLFLLGVGVALYDVYAFWIKRFKSGDFNMIDRQHTGGLQGQRRFGATARWEFGTNAKRTCRAIGSNTKPFPRWERSTKTEYRH